MTTGESYGFFDCRASKEEIKQELPNIRHMAQTPSSMSLYLMEISESAYADPQLVEIVKEAEKAGRMYIMEARYMGAINRIAAQELTDVLTQLWWSPLCEGDHFAAEIFYKEGERYILKDQET